MRKERSLQAIARRQHSLITYAQLRALGFSDAAIARRLALGRLYRVHRGVYAVGRPELSRAARFHAAVLAIGDNALLSHLACTAHFGVWNGAVGPIDVTVPRRVRARDGISVHTVLELPPEVVTIHLGIPVTTLARAILDAATVVNYDRAYGRLVHAAQAQKKTSVEKLQLEIDRSPRHRGRKRLATVIAYGPTPTRSGREDEAVELLRANGFPTFETNAHPPGAPSWVEVDIFFRAQKVIVEVDCGPWHKTEQRRQSDARKQALLEGIGYRVIRLTEEDLKPECIQQTLNRIWYALGELPAQAA
jgi:predicted transcriptional regulator of viral defense system